MGELRDSRSQSPHSVAFLAALMVLGAGFGVGAYCLELRGPGLSALLAGEQAPELVILCGAVLAMAVVVQLHVARAARIGNPTQALRSMLRRALTCLDASEEGSGEMQDLPPEMRDIVGMVAVERSRAEDAKREMQGLRRDMNGLLQGMERSASALEPLREDTTNEFAVRAAKAWNNLLERKETVRHSDSGPTSMTLDLGARPMHLPQEQPPVAAAPEALQDIAQRLAQLETSLARYHDEMRAASVQRRGLLSPAETVAEPSVLSIPELPADDVLADMRMSTRAALPRLVPEPQETADFATKFAPPVEALAPAGPARPRARAQEIAQSRGEVAPPPPAQVASVSGYHEWTGQSGTEGAWSLQEEADAALRVPAAATDLPEFEGTTAFKPPAPFLDDTYAVPSRGAPAGRAAEPRPAQARAPFAPAPPIPAETLAPEPLAADLDGPDFRFPHFVGKPGGQAEGRVAVTFEGVSPATSGPDAAAPDEATGVTAAGRSLIFDLRALGAVELEE